MSEIIFGMAAFLSAGTALYTTVRKSRKDNKLSCKIDIVILRYFMIQIRDRCEDKGYRTQSNDNIFYEMFEIYTKKLGQNSYICQEVEPSFRAIDKK